MAAMPMHLIEVQSMGQDLAQKTVCVKVRLGRLGNTRKVSNSQVEVDTDKSLLLISKHLLDSKELRTIANFDGEIRRYLYRRNGWGRFPRAGLANRWRVPRTYRV